MQYLYRADGGEINLILKDDNFKYLIKARRHKIGDVIPIRNLKDKNIYFYKIENIGRKSINIQLIDSKEHIIEANKELNIGWCMVDTKIVEKALPALNEIGVSSITFIYCKRSQRNFKLDFKRLEKILINSSQQSGRDNLMNLNILNSLEEFIKIYPDAKILNFSKNQIKENIKSIVIGCEGGFSSDEINLFNKEDIVGFKTSQILKSQTAVCAVASKILL